MTIKFPGGVLGALTVLFAAGKIFGYISWSWWLVLLPLWAPIAVIFGLGLMFLAILFLVELATA